MEKLNTILENRPVQFFSIGPDATLSEALEMLCAHQTEYLAVLDASGQFQGLLTWPEVAKKILESSRALRKIRVSAIMITEPPYVDFNDTLEHCILMMTGFGVRMLPVYENTVFRTILSIDDILKEVVRMRSQIFGMIENLENTPSIPPTITKRII